MGYINPTFSSREKINKLIKKTSVHKKNTQKNIPRKPRKDKTHNIKFPVDPITQRKLKGYCKEGQRLSLILGKEPLTQTKFNTALLRHGLNNLELVKWNHQYQDTKVYMHTNPLLHEYEQISGRHGLSIQKNLNDRRVVYQIILSVINALDTGGISLEKIIE